MEQRILDFIAEHHLLTFAAGVGSDIWCASAFYVFNPQICSFIITSDQNTRHIQLAINNNPDSNLEDKNNIVAGTVALETEKIGMIQGLQFKAAIKKADGSLFNEHRLLYLKRFPYAILKGSDLWILELLELKFTDNRLGFGKKLHWTRDAKF
ncbi:MAG: hypothetical protein RSC28_06140 [Bacteroidales bacterium]